MSYAVKKDGTGFRAVLSENDVDVATEVFSTSQPMVALTSLVTGAIATTYTDVDAIYAAAIGNRKTEYEEAEQAALAFQAAGYTGTASPYVADYAVTADITDQQSADLIIARANGLRAAVLAMRSTRFTAQSAMRAATTPAELDAAVAAWRAFITQVRTSLGL
jgi:adenylosuccinate lyase